MMLRVSQNQNRRSFPLSSPDTTAHCMKVVNDAVEHTHLEGHLVFSHIAQNDEAFSLCFYRAKAQFLCRAGEENENTHTHTYSYIDKQPLCVSALFRCAIYN